MCVLVKRTGSVDSRRFNMKNILIKQKMFELEIDDKRNTNLAPLISEMLL